MSYHPSSPSGNLLPGFILNGIPTYTHTLLFEHRRVRLLQPWTRHPLPRFCHRDAYTAQVRSSAQCSMLHPLYIPFNRAGDSCLLVHLVLTFATSAFCFAANFFSLHHLWFTVYRLSPGARDSDLEDANSSRRVCWTEALQRMRKIWTLSMTVCVVVAP